MPPWVRRELSGWARYPVEACHEFRPERRGAVAEILASGGQSSYIARGLGRSYGDCALNRGAGVVNLTRLDRFLNFDEDTGEVRCEAGVSFEALLQTCLPRGWFPPVTPGTKFVTVGGAIANDIHGKNHHADGTFGAAVNEMTLLTPNGERVVCGPQRNADLFWATVGGAGLTGFILDARFRMLKVETAYLKADHLRVKGLAEAMRAMLDSDAGYRYSVAWIDGLARGKSLGRSVLMRANHARLLDLPAGTPNPLWPPPRGRCGVPFNLPSLTLNRWSVRAFNTLYYATHGDAAGKLVDFDAYFYPLDSIAHWYRLYGRRGFVQFQVSFPAASAEAGLAEVLEKLSASGRASFLAVLKRFGAANAGWLSFPSPGFTLALDLPMRDGLPRLLGELESRVLAHGGRIYAAKDALTTADAFRAMYPELGRFRALRAELDPRGLLSSSLARRLGLARAGAEAFA